MTKYHESEHQFKYTWEQVCHAFWCRYPNPYSSHVLSEDVLERRVDAEGKLITKRLFSKTTSVVPKWVERLGLLPKGRTAYIVEESIVDPVNKMLTTYTCNIGMRHILNVQERCILRAMPDNCAATLVQRWARFESSLRGLSGTVCTFASERFKYNVHKATNGFQLVLEAMYSPHLMLRDNRLDHVTLSQLHPMLRTRLLERARSFKEVAKEAALPLLAVASANDNNSNNVN